MWYRYGTCTIGGSYGGGGEDYNLSRSAGGVGGARNSGGRPRTTVGGCGFRSGEGAGKTSATGYWCGYYIGAAAIRLVSVSNNTHWRGWVSSRSGKVCVVNTNQWPT